MERNLNVVISQSEILSSEPHRAEARKLFTRLQEIIFFEQQCTALESFPNPGMQGTSSGGAAGEAGLSFGGVAEGSCGVGGDSQLAAAHTGDTD